MRNQPTIQPGVGPTGWTMTPSPSTNMAELTRACRAFNLRPFVTGDLSVLLVTADDFEGEPPTGDELAEAMFGCQNAEELPVMLRRQAE